MDAENKIDIEMLFELADLFKVFHRLGNNPLKAKLIDN